MRLKSQRLLIILCCVLQVCVLVEGLYQLEVTVFGYNNPTGRCQGCGDSQSCCDDFITVSCVGSALCDSFFIYCLRTIGSTGRGCSYFGNRISDVNTNDRPLNFSQNMVLGLENPIILQGLTDTYMGVQFHIEIIDSDSTSADDLIDVLLIEHNLPIGQPSPRRTYTGIYGFDFVTMDLSITARCVENFQGSDCSRCLPGFTGIMCSVRISECSCSGRGQCLDGVPLLICDCDPGYTGVECEANINDCIEVTCSENGQCLDGLLSYTCECDPGYTGVDCEVNINDCMGVNCNGNGQCVEGLLSYTCDCDSGFTGVDCETNIDDCVGVNCSGNGVCFDGVNAFTCQCSPGFGGELCTKVMEIRDGLPLVPIVGGVIGGVLISMILLVLMVLLIVIMCRIVHKQRRSNTDINLSIETKENEAYGVSVATAPEQPHEAHLQKNTLMNGNPCYATTQHVEMVDNECYHCAPESQPTDQSYSYVRV